MPVIYFRESSLEQQKRWSQEAEMGSRVLTLLLKCVEFHNMVGAHQVVLLKTLESAASDLREMLNAPSPEKLSSVTEHLRDVVEMTMNAHQESQEAIKHSIAAGNCLAEYLYRLKK
jgi:hypothetical protein